ncbi:Ms4533A family Cys-rich leader peptide [Peterkaempfera bronchialis]|nr:Ms4533A family Cys-rich leader peptide [Peterkaempfera bronchialis]
MVRTGPSCRSAAFRLALLGVAALCVADVDCR